MQPGCRLQETEINQRYETSEGTKKICVHLSEVQSSTAIASISDAPACHRPCWPQPLNLHRHSHSLNVTRQPPEKYSHAG